MCIIDSAGAFIDIVGAFIGNVGVFIDSVGAFIDSIGAFIGSVGAFIDSVCALIDSAVYGCVCAGLGDRISTGSGCGAGPCLNNGSCVPHNESAFYCLCPHGYNGTICQNGKYVTHHMPEW